jgi:hypothetical protein
MFFFDKLQLLELLRQDDVETYRAADKTTGQDYLLHWLPPDDSPQLARVMGLLDGLDEDARRLLIEVGRRYGRRYLITENPPTFTGLEAWLHAVKDFLGTTSLEKKGTWRIPAEFIESKSAAADTPAVSGPGEFTRLMRAAPTPAPQEPVTSEISPPQPGDFTLLMRQSGPASPPSAPAPPAPAAPQQVSPQSGDFTRYMRQVPPPPHAGPAAQASEFTRLMQANPAPAPPGRVMRPVPRQEAGEFTRLFAPPSAPDVNDLAPRKPAGDGLPEQTQAGEFTRFMQANPAPAPPERVMRPAPRQEAGEFTRLFAPPSTPDVNDLMPRKPAGDGLPEQAQAGEFTRLFKQPASHPTPLLPREDPFGQPYSPAEFSSDFTRNFGSRPGSAPEPSSSSDQGATHVFARPAVPPASVPRPAEGPGEYTRMFAAPAAASGAAPPVAAPSAPPTAAPQIAVKGKAEPGLWIFLAALALLAVCAILLIVYFVFKK